MAFASAADNLSDEDNQFLDVFVRDLLTNTTTLMSPATTATGFGGDRSSGEPSISADGCSVTRCGRSVYEGRPPGGGGRSMPGAGRGASA